MKNSTIGELGKVKNFSLFLALGVSGIVLLLLNLLPGLRSATQWELDAMFRLRPRDEAIVIQEGAVAQGLNPRLNPDILLLGVDTRTLSRFGRWPFPRFRHADLLNTLTRIKDQDQRESAVLLDFFFIDSTEDPVSDALLSDAIFQNGNLLLEVIPNVDTFSFELQKEMDARFSMLHALDPSLSEIQGNWLDMPAYQGMENPLVPFIEGSAGYGHAVFQSDSDGSFRRQPLVLKYTQPIDEISLTAFITHPEILDSIDYENYQRFGFLDSLNYSRSIPVDILTDPDELTSFLQANSITRSFSDPEGQEIEDYFIRMYQDYFIPAITLRLAAHHLHVPLEQIQVVLGEHIVIPSPKAIDPQTGELGPYRILRKPAVYDEQENIVEPAIFEEPEEIQIPIDDWGNMVINYLGPRSSEDSSGFQTFPVRSYAGYAARATGPIFETWPETLLLDNKIIMAGAFSSGMADDEKLTPYGLMYGVEVHANALNTILMTDFLYPVESWVQILTLFGLTLVVGLISGRVPTIWAFVITVLLLVGGFLINVYLVFSEYSYVFNYSVPAVSALLTFVLIIIYRVVTEEKDKRMIRSMFSRYVSPGVVNEILQNPPELGGVDKELTVFFSDIRGFTTLSEALTPQELVAHLNLYLTAMTNVILEFQGTLDKYVGDEIMCFWGAPLPQADHAYLACRCAIRQIDRLNELNAGWPPEKQIKIGIGINSGIMTVGNMGSLGRMNYTLMGDNVNLGARLEGTNKQYLTQIIISEYTYGLVKNRVIARELDTIRVKGKNKPVVIYELLDIIE
ncbi:MAG: adenylate/guanylate cyclase domain-containing protein [Spirochaetales bacterium]|nr:adenylate/guanylate cyclase domain-containing protein [Spirochaetales bacterium]